MWQQLELASEFESDPQDTVDWGRKWLVDFSSGKTQLLSFDRSNNTGIIDVKMNGSVLEEKSPFKMLGLTFSSKLDWGSYIISIAKTASKKIVHLIRSMKSPSCDLELLDKLQKRICTTDGPSLAASLELLAYRRNIASLSLFYRYYFGRCSSELVGLLVILIDCLIFLSPFVDVTRMSMSIVSFFAQRDPGILCL